MLQAYEKKPRLLAAIKQIVRQMRTRTIVPALTACI